MIRKPEIRRWIRISKRVDLAAFASKTGRGFGAENLGPTLPLSDSFAHSELQGAQLLPAAQMCKSALQNLLLNVQRSIKVLRGRMLARWTPQQTTRSSLNHLEALRVVGLDRLTKRTTPESYAGVAVKL